MRKSAIFIIFFFLILSCASSDKKTKNPAEKNPEKIKDGISEEFWDDNSLKGRGSVENFKKTGNWVLFAKGTGGTVKLAEGSYVNDMQHGEWFYYYQDGSVRLQGDFEQGQKTGEWTEFYQSGKVLSKCKYSIKTDNSSGTAVKYGVIEGTKITYFENGKIQMEEMFQNGLKKGKTQIYYENSQTRQTSWYEQNLKNGKFNEWYPNGNIKVNGFMNDDKPSGKWTFYFDKGTKQMEGKFEKGLMSGIWRTYYTDGKAESFGEYSAGKKTGIWTYLNQKGQVTRKLTLNGDMVAGRCWLYENGKITGEGEMSGLADKPDKNGQWIEFHPNGKVKFEGAYIMGKREGKFKEYYPSGNLESEGEYMMGELNGICTFYREDKSIDEEKSGNYMIGKKFDM
ncbi:MAG: hypothetical protein JW982_15150 [Spirochaetes bacterium]|nr:hypothetical protein [Spirochaetota bacterium]